MRYQFVLALFFGLIIAGCGAPKQGQGGMDAGNDGGVDIIIDASGETNDSTQPLDVSNDSELKDIGGGSARWKKPAGYASLVFCVDDSANKTYRNGQIRWTGSFSWDKKTNIIKYASSWLPTDGPFVPLYDDGPISKGGHEPEGEKAGDHKFCAEVYFKADKDYTIEYGALDEFDHWIWVGPNGTVDIPKGSTKTYTLKPLILHKFGDVDVKFTINMKELNDQFKAIDPSQYSVYVKSSANSWTPVQLLDNGKNGDDKAGDGIFTYVHSKHLGPHDGLCWKGEHVQFVFVFAMQGFDPEDGQEYKVGPQCAIEGVKAYTDLGHKGTFDEAPVLMERDSRGKVFNTTIIIGGGKPWCKVDDDCFKGKCKDGGCEVGQQGEELKVESIQPDQGPVEGGTQVTITGDGFVDGTQVKFGDTTAADVVVKDKNTITCTTPAHPAGKVDVIVSTPDGKTDTLTGGFEFVEQKPQTKIEEAKLLDPLNVTTQPGIPTQELHALVKVPDITGNGEPQGIYAQVGYGDSLTDPDSDNSWKFVDATYEKDQDGGSVYSGVLSVDDPGEYSFTFRFSLDGENWVYADSSGLSNGFDPANMGTLTVKEEQTNQLSISGVEPVAVKVDNPGEVKINGSGFKDGLKVYFDDQEVEPKSVTENTIAVDAPEHKVGWVTIKVVNPDNTTASKEHAMLYVPFGTPTIDGTIGDDWKPQWKIASNSLNTDWQGNELHNLYVAYDKDNLYIGVDGFVEKDKTNYIVGYLDMNYRVGGGINDMSKITDNNPYGGLDDALSSILVAKDPDFAADYAFGSRGMQSFHQGDDLGQKSVYVGWRGLSKPDDLAWLDGNAVCSDTACEFSIPLITLFTQEPHVNIADMAIFVAIVNQDGKYVSNQSLPQKDGNDKKQIPDALFTIYLF